MPRFIINSKGRSKDFLEGVGADFQKKFEVLSTFFGRLS